METSHLIGKTAVWKIRVYGPAKFAERSGVIAFISGNSAFTHHGHELRLGDMVATPGHVVGGGSWAAIETATVGPVKSRQGVDPRGVWMRQNIPSRTFDEGRFAGVPMHGLRIATIVANTRAE